ncbi:hypothetical protein [Streptococcus orisratti]|uniref:hypothetical protein n=1 Tax=Streptococcus orisratti TaxID=114652 RepID=UPI002943061A|nr:hypothetical protein [Streptococcus orisratti]
MEQKQKVGCLSSIITIILLVWIASFFVSGNDSKKNNSKETKTEQTTSTTKEKTTETTQEVKNDGKDYTEVSNTEFATHLTTEINNQLNSTGYQVRVQPVGNNVIYLYVPQDIKYSSNSEIQQISDNLYTIKENTFSTWAIDNGYDLGFTNSPDLYIKAEDDTTLAEESGIVNKSMKVKVNN